MLGKYAAAAWAGLQAGVLMHLDCFWMQPTHPRDMWVTALID